MARYNRKKFVKHIKRGIAGAAAHHVVKKVVKKFVKPAYRKALKLQEPLDFNSGHSGIGGTTIKINESGHKLKLLKKQSKMGLWKYQQTHKYILSSVSGTQSIFDICTVNSVSQILTSSSTTYAFNQNCIALEQLNPYLLNTGSTYLPNNFLPLNDRFIINNNSINMEFTNFSPIGAIIDVYILKAKKLNKDSAVNTWSYGLTDDALGQTNAGLPAAGTGTFGSVGSPTPFMVGVKPTDASLFKSYWKIASVKHFTLSPASTEQLNIDIGIDRVVKMVDVREEASSAMLYRPSTTYQIMVVSRGALVLDNTTATLQTPTFGQTKVGLIVTAHTHCSAVKGGNSNRLSVNTAYSSIPSNATATNQSLLNEVDVAITAAAQA